MTDGTAEPGAPRAPRLKEAVRQARIDLAERTGVVVDLHDAEVARLEILNEALDPLFADIPAEVELFERGITRGDPPRLWIDMIAHVVMGRDKRLYRFVQDTRYGRRVLGETADVEELCATDNQRFGRELYHALCKTLLPLQKYPPREGKRRLGWWEVDFKFLP